MRVRAGENFRLDECQILLNLRSKAKFHMSCKNVLICVPRDEGCG